MNNDMMYDLEAAIKKLLDGCVIMSHNGVKLFTPDGQGNYRALWTRDFTYMVEYATELMDSEEIRQAFEYLLDKADTDGWIPDRVDETGTAFFTAGYNFPAKRNLDNGAFLIICADCYLNTIDPATASGLFKKWKSALVGGVECLPVDRDSGLMYNAPDNPHSPYGFTDCVCKTGLLSMESLLLWRAYKILAKRLRNNIYERRAALIEQNLYNILSDENGMLLAATVDCCQTDIWASCYAVSIGFPMTGTQKEGIARYLIEHYEGIVEHGQIRHLPEGIYWDRLIVDIKPGEYQNGAFWATATGWFADAVATLDFKHAKNTIADVIYYFEKQGIFECVNGRYHKLDTYVASATNVYAAYNKYSLSK